MEDVNFIRGFLYPGTELPISAFLINSDCQSFQINDCFCFFLLSSLLTNQVLNLFDLGEGCLFDPTRLTSNGGAADVDSAGTE